MVSSLPGGLFRAGCTPLPLICRPLMSTCSGGISCNVLSSIQFKQPLLCTYSDTTSGWGDLSVIQHSISWPFPLSYYMIFWRDPASRSFFFQRLKQQDAFARHIIDNGKPTAGLAGFPVRQAATIQSGDQVVRLCASLQLDWLWGRHIPPALVCCEILHTSLVGCYLLPAWQHTIKMF